MNDALRDSARVWGVHCSDGQVLWVDDEDAANRVLTSLIGAERVVHRATSDDPPTVSPGAQRSPEEPPRPRNGP
jgi:hypothetical protein